MKIQDLVGKVVVRTKTVENEQDIFSFSFGKSSRDAAYTDRPILVEAVENDVVYYRGQIQEKINILSAKYHDDNWAPVSEKYLPEIWPVKERANIDGKFMVGRRPSNTAFDVRTD